MRREKIPDPFDSFIGIRRRLIAEGTAVGAEGIVDAIRLKRVSGSVGIGRGIRIVRIRAQLPEIFRWVYIRSLPL